MNNNTYNNLKNAGLLMSAFLAAAGALYHFEMEQRTVASAQDENAPTAIAMSKSLENTPS